jgi:hypothetical protein
VVPCACRPSSSPATTPKSHCAVPRFGARGIWERDDGICQYTGRKLAPKEGNIDHFVPRSRGGKTSWQVVEPLAAAIPDLKKGIELLLVAPKNPLLTKTLIEFTRWAEENNSDYEALCEKPASDSEGSSEP